ncbi:MAG: indolepyruvate ferredoxin oxidoreductase family protein [Bryobacteraceae bacterium]
MRLTDKYTAESGVVYLTGIQALVRLALEQMRLDRDAGLRTGCYITGYEGSPLGGYDFALARAGSLLREHDIHFRPAMNEDLAATSIFGTQIVNVLGDKGKPATDGVVGIWYGKGPGVDRSGDALRHANLSGTPGLSAALVLAGDDHPCKSSSIPHQSDFSLYNVNIPILFPGNAQEILDYGLYAIALSRYSGAWTSLKLLTQTCDGGGAVEIDRSRYRYASPPGYQKRTDARLVPGIALGLEHEANVHRLAAVLEFGRANPVNRWVGGRNGVTTGIVTAGKYYYDVMQALAASGIAEDDLDAMGISIAKFGMTYPLEPGFVRDFADPLETIVVVEEKRSFVELQLREALFNLSEHPMILGKRDESGASLFPPTGELDPDRILEGLARAIPELGGHPGVRRRLAEVEAAHARPIELKTFRAPNYCSGCPHNRSTLLFEGQAAGGGIGCHGMGFLLEDADRGYSFATQMGGEGAAWFGMAPFAGRDHIFQNIGDGTYFHSGSLAIQAAVASGVNITYKLLYNGHVAMTGGQDAVGAIPIPALTRKLEAEGVRRTVIVAEDPDRYSGAAGLAANASVRGRAEFEAVTRELEKTAGVTVLIYDQECAAEKRRARSRGKYAEPARRLVIHEEVCEGCWDCVRQSNCMSLQPVETPLGEKMRIHQPSCNKDYSCALGDCPSFVTVNVKPGTGLRKEEPAAIDTANLPAPPPFPDLAGGYRILSPGIGGTGVVTINALLAAAAVMDGLHAITLDQTGLAQKGGAVVSHLLLSRAPLEAAAKTNAASASLVLAFDLVTALQPDQLRCLASDRTRAAVNRKVTPTAESIRKRLPVEVNPAGRLKAYAIPGAVVECDAAGLSERHFGTHMMTNMILLGAAWQVGFVPLTLASIEAAIRLNNVEIERNLQAFALGRHAAIRRNEPNDGPEPPRSPDYDSRLRDYQDSGYAVRFRDFVERVRARRPDLAEAAARGMFRLMAVKDEYEVARMLSSPAFRRGLDEQWEAVESIAFHLHPPLLRRLGRTAKVELGEWALPLLRVLAALKFVRGTRFDVFGYTAHRRLERSLPAWYEKAVIEALDWPDPDAVDEVVGLADTIRGYEGIKEAKIAAAKSRLESLRSTVRTVVAAGA